MKSQSSLSLSLSLLIGAAALQARADSGWHLGERGEDHALYQRVISFQDENGHLLFGSSRQRKQPHPAHTHSGGQALL
jgi:hypothetical protein